MTLYLKFNLIYSYLSQTKVFPKLVFELINEIDFMTNDDNCWRGFN